MKIKRSRIFAFLFLLLLLTPLFLWIFWLLTPRKPINILIVDKTVLTKEGNEHKAFNWYLENRKYTKPDTQFYVTSKDYKGFFPLENKKFEIHDLHAYSKVRLDSLADVLDMVYYTDTYGIYHNEWYEDTLLSEHSSKIYGGLDLEDVQLLKRLKNQNKLILTEFNFFASPTRRYIRRKAGKLLGIKWSGWTLRFFANLDTVTNKEIPHWMTRLYMEQHGGQWPFKVSGIVFVNQDERIEILDGNRDLVDPEPIIYAEEKGADHYNLPKKLEYPYWIDITYPISDSLELLSHYEIHPTSRGDSILQNARIPESFPSVIASHNRRFFYFCGDYADNKIRGYWVYFKGFDWLKRHIIKDRGAISRNTFYWNFYVPMMDVIMEDYYKDLQKK